ncbi:MAG TPA: cation diffusion facilitator family transporter [Mycobacteriales bacterium]|nr:cation diffusion facilitator family transporter [Mycobacteriales bacterium]
MGHDHGHASGSGTAAAGYRGRLLAVLGITLGVLVVEVVAGLLSGSLALLADAAHLGTDALGIGLALLAVRMGGRAPTVRRTFGWQRAEVLAAGANAVLLLGLAGAVVVEAVRRLTDPPPIEPGTVLVVGALGLVANAVGLALLARGQSESLNVRGAFLEVLGDTFGSLAVLVAAAVVALTGQQRADPIASLLIAVLIVPRAIKLLRDTGEVLLEGTPRGVDLAEVRRHMLAQPGVVDVHDLHAWTITSGVPVLSAHVTVEGSVLTATCGGGVLDRLHDCLREDFDVEHSTFQLEPAGHRDHEGADHH